MYLSRFGVKNYKCLGDIDIPLTPIHVLIGQNGCGKTSLLEAMEAFFATSEKKLVHVFPEPRKGRELVRHQSSEPRIELWGRWDRIDDDEIFVPFQYGLSLDFAATEHDCQVVGEYITFEEEKPQFLIRDQNHPQTVVKQWNDKGHLSNTLSVGVPEAACGVLKPAHKYAFNARQMALPAVFDPARQFRLETDGFGLATLLDDILGFNPNIFLDIREEFCQLFPQFRSVRIATEYAVERHTQSDGLPQSSVGTGKGIYFEMQSGETVRARHASDGAILFLGLLALAHLPKPPGLLLLEEPENGVYPIRLGQIVKLLKAMVNRTEGVRFPQIVLTTHSPYVLSFFEPEEVTLLSREEDKPDSPVRARPLRDAPDIKARMAEDELYLGELWYNFTEKELFGGA